MIGGVLPQVFLGSAQRRLFAEGTPILTYHSVGHPPRGARDPFLFVTPADFSTQLSRLREAGFSAGSLDDLATHPLQDQPRKKVVLTFDDGCRNVFVNALPHLERQGFRAIQFLVAGLIGKTNVWDGIHGDAEIPLMDTLQVREWLAAGHEIGSHGLTHRNLPKLGTAEAREQIFASKKLLEDLFGVEVRHFAYPHGKWSERVMDLVAEAGYRSACTTDFGVNDTNTPRYLLRRIVPLGSWELCRKAVHRMVKRSGLTH